ncbi:iron chelate uptake ABC transporter family permease subunit [Nocardia sp. NPDC050712]|uniref:FecCD family ABC transporter permease n=1 Tax=Nocardia sp. NPDC050712 TaxID=3155518 RepID=UPI0033E97FA9
MKTAPRVDFGRRTVVLRAGDRFSFRVGLRTPAVIAVLLLACAVVAVLALGTGDYQLAPKTVVQAVFGDSTRLAEFVVMDLRMPRVLLALLLGAALGASGAIFQSLTRNPLGSPDVIGFNTGAYTGALVVMLIFGGGYRQTATGALVGGILTAAIIYGLSYKGGMQGFRLIIAGIAISTMLQSVNVWLLLKVDVNTAMAAAVWGSGSLTGLDWDQVTPVAVALAVLLPGVLWLAYRMPLLELGDDTAQALGLRLEPTRLTAVLVGVALTAVATAAAGPIAFLSLAAPQLARRLTRSATVAPAPAAALGALLLLLSDWIAQRAFAPTQLPVGVVTVSIGGAYFVWLLAREARR